MEPLLSASEKPQHRSWAWPWAALLLLLWSLAARKLTDLDMGFHLKAAQWMLAHHAVPTMDSFTWGAQGHPYLDSHWLYQLVLYGFYKMGSYPALTLMNIALLTGVFLFLILRLRQTTAPSGLQCFSVLFALLIMEKRFLVRPEIFSWFFLSVTLWILEEHFQKRRNYLWALPLIQLVWANMEGLFVLGWLAIAAYLISSTFRDKKLDLRALSWAALALVADLIGPNGLQGFLYPLSFISKLQNGNIYHETVFELVSPWVYILGNHPGEGLSFTLALYVLFSAILLLLFLLTRAQRPVHEWLLFLGFFYLSCTAVRNVSLYIMVVMPIAANAACQWFSRSTFASTTSSRWSRRRKTAPYALALFILLWCVRVWTNAFYVDQQRFQRFGLGLDPEVLPVKTVAFLDQNHLDGKLLNHINLGGWVDWQAPQPAFIDGRLEVMGDDLCAELFQSMRPGGLSALLDKYHPQLVLFEYSTVHTWDSVLNQSADWRLIDADECAALYATPGYAASVPSLDFGRLLTERNIASVSDDQLATLLAGIHPSPWIGRFQGFYSEQVYPRGLMNLAILSIIHGQDGTAESLLAECLRRTEGRSFDVLFTLGEWCFRKDKRLLAEQCAQKALVLEPGNQGARALLLACQGAPSMGF